MKNSQYIDALKKALASMDKKSREDILLEIKSHAEDSGADEFSLLERFGSPDELAQQYLDESPIPPAKTSWMKRIFQSIGLIVVGLIIFLTLLFWFLSQDDFDYADEQASELNLDSSEWLSQVAPDELHINLKQSKATFYWHAENSIHWNCKGRDSEMKPQGNTFEINQGKCLIFLPQQTIHIDIDQANAVIVRPQADVSINIEQGSLQIAENGTNYHYKISSNDAKIDEFKSNTEADVLIDITAKQSSVVHYEY